MTSSNFVDVSRQNGHTQAHDKTPEAIQLEIARTRSAITEDLLALAEKLSPEHLRENARELMCDAREQAKELLHDAKDAALGSLRDMKDRAIERVSDKVHGLGREARHASDATLMFMSANAVAMSLLGLGAGLLFVMLRARPRLLPRHTERSAEPRYPTLELYPCDDEAAQLSAVRSTATAASRAVERAREQVRSARAHSDQRAHELTQQTRQGVRHTYERAREVAVDHRLAVVVVTVAAGLGLGLLLPVSRRPRAAVRRAGARMWDSAQSVGHELESRASALRDRARSHDAPSELGM